MSKGLSAIFNELSGTLGNTVASPGPGGITYLRAKPLEVNQPNTILQQKQKSRFTLVQALAALMLSFIRYNFKKLKPTHSEYNSFMSINTKALNDWDDTSNVDPYTLMTSSRGPLASGNGAADPNGTPAVVNGSLAVDMLFEDSTGNDAVDPDDVLHYVTVAPESGAIRSGSLTHKREKIDPSIAVPLFAGVTNYVALFYKSVTDGSVSTSKFMFKVDGSNVITEL